ncbi:hypothetical protein DIZ27_32880 [Streptomyces sp. NWU339]|uniref:hypothetical protein n=1 Tax=Streptomyces sp. NWU339 TaxID=2185284 RepID=UPI000D683C08|nr:hypothetical protein [Streptomyces sp. NWU339]PWI06537.1 hypothetical protein DIZ27_32880 [Streptomyces sp. NWU339]
MLNDYMAVGGVEVVNHARLRAYLGTVGSPLDSGAEICACDSLTADVLDHLPYTTPDDPDSPAPWWDPDVPESAAFAGFMALSIDGVDDSPVRRTVTNAVIGGGAIGPARALPRTITVTGILLGATCCAVEYGLHWLGEALQGCGGSSCGGDCVTMYNCCPGEEMTSEEFNARHRRTFRRVALVDGPTVTGRSGSGSCAEGRCQSGADIVSVEFVLVAASPWAWTDSAPLLAVAPPVDDSDTCVTWCLTGSTAPGCAGACQYAECLDPEAQCTNPRCVPPAPPGPTALDTCFCLPLATERACYDIDLSHLPQWSVSAPMITVHAGVSDLRNVTITLYEKTSAQDLLTCDEIADLNRCSPHSVYSVQYVPAGGALTIDGQVGRAVVECGGGCESSRDVSGANGAPPSFKTLDCASYCLCITTDVSNPPAENATVSLAVSGRGY